MPTPSLLIQELCQRGQALLAQTEYLAAERALMDAEQLAWETQNWESLSRLYMPLQEARRQTRQIALRGTILLNICPEQSTPDSITASHTAGEVLLAGDANILPGITLRRLAAEKKLYIEAFLAAAYQIGDNRAVVVVALESAALPPANQIQTIDQLLHYVPPHSLVLPEIELINSPAFALSLWERLHLPYLIAADAEVDPIRRMAGYRRTILVDNACELAHQKLSDIAAHVSRKS